MKYKGWNFEKTLLISSDDSIDRQGVLVDAFVTVPAEYAGNVPNDIRVVLKKSWNEIDRELPSQAYGVERKDGVASFRVVFSLDLPPHGNARVGVYYDNPSAEKPVYQSDFTLRYDGGPGFSAESRYYRARADEGSGQIDSLTMKTSRKEYTYPKTLLAENRPLPGAAVIFAVKKNASWRAESVALADWNAPEIVRKEQGPLFFALTRKGVLPVPEGALCETPPAVTATYTFPAGEPVILMDTEIFFPGEAAIFGLQGGSVRVQSDKFSHFTFRPVTKTFPRTEIEEMGHVLVDPALTKDLPEGNVMASLLPSDLAWHAFIRIYKGSRANQYALTSINLEARAEGPVYRQACYLFREGESLLACRAPVYVKRTDRKENIVRVPAGSRYVFRDALHLGMWDPEKWAIGVEDLGRRLNNPLAIKAFPKIAGRIEPDETPAVFSAGTRKAAYDCAGVR